MFEAIVRRGTLMTVIILIVGVLGVMAALRIPVQMIPDLEVRTITVRTSWPGATPQDIEKEIVIEQEEYLRSIPGLQRIISSSSSFQIWILFPYLIPCYPGNSRLKKLVALRKSKLGQVIP